MVHIIPVYVCSIKQAPSVMKQLPFVNYLSLVPRPTSARHFIGPSRPNKMAGGSGSGYETTMSAHITRNVDAFASGSQLGCAIQCPYIGQRNFKREICRRWYGI